MTTPFTKSSFALLKKSIVNTAAICLMVLYANVCHAQQKPANENLRKFIAVADAYRSALAGYRDQDPKAMINAIRSVNGYRPRLASAADSVQLTDAVQVSPSTGSKTLDLSPLSLLNDAETMNTGDTFVTTILALTRMVITNDTFMVRGRKFSPLVQEFHIRDHGSVKLWATFTGNEPAEVFVSLKGNTALDLFVTDITGNPVASDMNRPQQCYVSFVPEDTRKYCIEIRNKDAVPAECLLMTN